MKTKIFFLEIINGISATNENTLNVQTLQMSPTDKSDREMVNIVDTVEDRIQNTILTSSDNIIIPRIELVVRSKNASSGRDAANVTANSERWEHTEITVSSENVSDRNNTFHESNADDEIRGTFWTN